MRQLAQKKTRNPPLLSYDFTWCLPLWVLQPPLPGTYCTDPNEPKNARNLSSRACKLVVICPMGTGLLLDSFDYTLFKIIASQQIYSLLGLMFSLNRVWSESHHFCFRYNMRFKVFPAPFLNNPAPESIKFRH